MADLWLELTRLGDRVLVRAGAIDRVSSAGGESLVVSGSSSIFVQESVEEIEKAMGIFPKKVRPAKEEG